MPRRAAPKRRLPLLRDVRESELARLLERPETPCALPRLTCECLFTTQRVQRRSGAVFLWLISWIDSYDPLHISHTMPCKLAYVSYEKLSTGFTRSELRLGLWMWTSYVQRQEQDYEVFREKVDQILGKLTLNVLEVLMREALVMEHRSRSTEPYSEGEGTGHVG